MNSIVKKKENTSLSIMDNFEKNLQFAELMLKSGFLPTTIKTPAQAIAIIAYGNEVGIPPMESLQQINVVNGRPAMGAQLIRSLILSRCEGAKITRLTDVNDREKCVLKAERPGQEPKEYIFTWTEASKIKSGGRMLVDKDSWKNYPADMLLARATTRMARDYFPDICSWISYTPEELESVQPAALPPLYKKTKEEEEPEVITVDTEGVKPVEPPEPKYVAENPAPEPEYIGEEKTLEPQPERTPITHPAQKEDSKIQDLANRVESANVTTEQVSEVEKLREEMTEVFGDDPTTLADELITLSTFTGSDGKVRYKSKFEWLSEPHAAVCRTRLKITSFSKEMEAAGIPKEKQDEIVGFIAQELKYDNINGLNDIRSLKQLFPIRDQFRKAQN
jgi:hypothetical protein